ncbi:MAG: 16S rRNA (cytosine(967)-C(5))-methyltransferase RsmB [Candidatus Latescibacterota bacterium]
MNARAAALEIFRRVETDGAYVDELLREGLSGLSLKDRAFCRELALGAMRWRGRLDWALSLCLKGDLEGLPLPIRNVLRLGAYQILFSDGVPDRAAVHESVELAKRVGHRGTVGLVNAVLRKVSQERDRMAYPDLERDPAGYLCVVGSHPRWLCTRWIERFGMEEAALLCAANNRRRPVSVRVNRLKGTVEDFLARLEKEGFSGVPSELTPGFVEIPEAQGLFETDVFRSGWFQAQDPSAGLAGLLLDPQPGERVLDLCAAPGGKTTHLAELMGNVGTIVALDRHPRRVDRIVQNVRRLGIEIVQTAAIDALAYQGGAFDRVLVDAPCSGTGVFARRVDARWRLEEKDIGELVALQGQLLEKGASTLRPGGRLVYSTCTMEEEEDEGVVGDFLSRHPEFVLEPASKSIGPPFGDFVRTYPHRHGTDGSFAACLCFGRTREE